MLAAIGSFFSVVFMALFVINAVSQLMPSSLKDKWAKSEAEVSRPAPGLANRPLPPAPPAPAHPAAFGDFEYEFSNGAKATLVTDGPQPGLFWGQGAAAQNNPLVLGRPLEAAAGFRRISDRAFPPLLLQDKLDLFGGKAILIYVDDVPHVIGQDGAVTPLPVLAESARDRHNSVLWWTREPIDHAGRRYVIFEYRWKTPIKTSERWLNGEIFLIRDDGAFTRVALSNTTAKREQSLTDGILSVDQFYRQIDLDAFDLEKTFNARVHRLATDADSPTKPIDSLALVETLFTRVARAARPRPTDAASQSILARVVRALTTLAKSAVLLGQPGSGKTILAEEVVNYLPRTWRVLKITPDALDSSSRYSGNFNARVLAMKTASDFVPIVWLADEVHAFRGIGTHMYQRNDVFELLKQGMADGHLRWLGTSTSRDFNRVIGPDGALKRRFVSIAFDGYSPDQIQNILRASVKGRRGPPLSDDMLHHITAYARKFDPATADPARSLDLLKAVNEHTGEGNEITLDDVVRATHAHYNVPEAFTDPAVARQKLDQLESELERRLPGNPEAKAHLLRAAARALFGLTPTGRPRATGAFAGPRGVGKSSLVKAYAEILGLPFHKIEMAQFLNAHDVGALLAAVGDFVSQNPFGVVLLDEPDKSNPAVREALLGALESAQFTRSPPVGSGEDESLRVDVRHAQFYFATNAGQGLVLEAARRGGRVSKAALVHELNRDLSEFLVDRLDFVTAMFPADQATYRGIIELELRRAAATVHLDPERVLNWSVMIDALAETWGPAVSNRQPARDAAVIRDLAVDLMRDGTVDKMEYLRDMSFRFDPVRGKLEMVPLETCEQLFEASSNVVRFPGGGRS